ncbi:putative transposase [Oscillibacter valericigenes Sjm18-20]|nr:putative transposase [Oscillibacter valericigenes Sjm18-20]
MCNGCKRITRCRLQKQYYYGDFAQREYEAVRSESRQGIATAPEELRWIDAVISPLIKQGQSIHHICSTHADEIMLNEKTIYNYNDLPRKVRYRRRQKKN